MSQKTVSILPGAFSSNVNQLFVNAGFKIEHNPRKFGCDILVLTGGEDINPMMYGEKPISGVYFSNRRDSFEQEMVELFKDTPKIGICRGGQILNVLAGGKMWQDTDNHQWPHMVLDKNTGDTFKGSSIHHQMMRPGAGGEVLLIADESTYVENEKQMVLKENEPFDDVECVFYPAFKAFCFQGHPEIGNRQEVEWFFNQVHEKLGV